MPPSRACPSPSSRPSTRQPRRTCGWRGSWSPVVLSPDEDLRDRGSGAEHVDAPVDGSPSPDGFRVSLGVFDGPFDLLLTLISKHELDITEVSLVAGDRRVHRLPARARSRRGAGAGIRVPRRRRDAARHEGGGPPAAGRARRRRVGRAARSARPALRAAAAVPRVQGGLGAGSRAACSARTAGTRARSGSTRSTARRCPSSSGR